jgi:uncharacterized protein YggL (DUF469 family)
MTDVIRRPDLEAAQVSFPDYIGTKVYPWLGKPQIAGKLYFQKFKSDITAQYNRDHAALGDISQNVIAANDMSFSTTELRARVAMSYSQRIGYGDDEKADLAQGRLAKRAFFNKVEALIAAQVLNTTGAVDGTADPVSAIDTNVSLLRDAGIGRVALVIANATKIALKNNATIKDRMKNTGLGAYSIDEIRNVGDLNLAAALGVDEILTGKDAIWNTGAGKTNAALVVLPDEYEDPAEAVELGRLVYFMYTDSTDDRFVMESFHNAINDSEVVDCKGLVELKEFNAELRKTITLFADASDSSDASTSL